MNTQTTDKALEPIAKFQPWRMRNASEWDRMVIIFAGGCAAEFDRREDAELAIACVNVLAGTKDPTTELARLRGIEAGAAAMRAALEKCVLICEKGMPDAEAKRPEWISSALATNAGAVLMAELEALREHKLVTDAWSYTQLTEEVEWLRGKVTTEGKRAMNYSERWTEEVRTLREELTSLRLKVAELEVQRAEADLIGQRLYDKGLELVAVIENLQRKVAAAEGLAEEMHDARRTMRPPSSAPLAAWREANKL